MPRERDYVAAGHPEPVDEDHGQAVIGYAVDGDPSVHRPAVDADRPGRLPAQMCASVLTGTPPSQGFHQSQTGQNPAGRYNDPPQAHSRLPVLAKACLELNAEKNKRRKTDPLARLCRKA